MTEAYTPTEEPVLAPPSSPGQNPPIYSGKRHIALRLLLTLILPVLVGRFCVGLLLNALPRGPVYSHSLVDALVTALLVAPSCIHSPSARSACRSANPISLGKIPTTCAGLDAASARFF